MALVVESGKLGCFACSQFGRFIACCRLAFVTSLAIVVGCQRSAESPSIAPSLKYMPADLDFYVPPYDADFEIELYGNDSRLLSKAAVVLELTNSHTRLTRTVLPDGFNGESWTLNVKGIEAFERALLWVYESSIGLAAFRLQHEE